MIDIENEIANDLTVNHIKIRKFYKKLYTNFLARLQPHNYLLHQINYRLIGAYKSELPKQRDMAYKYQTFSYYSGCVVLDSKYQLILHHTLTSDRLTINMIKKFIFLSPTL